MKSLFFVLCSGVAIIAILITTIYGKKNIESDLPISFLGIIDAGSSGSRLVIYNSTKQSIFQLCHLSVEPGLSAYTRENVNIWELMNQLLKDGETCLHNFYPEVTNVSLYVYGTAGLRKMSEKETMPLFYTLIDQVHSHSYPFHLPVHQVSILSGEDEAKYGWYSVNYLSNLLDVNLNGNTKNYYGSLDLGGESLEITYYNDLRKKLQPFSYSFLGANSMRDQILQFLTDGLKSTTVLNPCYPTKYSETAYGNTVIGNTDIEECFTLVDSLFHSTTLCKEEGNKACFFVKKGLNQQNTTFYGMSLMYYVSDFLSFISTNTSIDRLEYEPVHFHEQLVEFAKMDWDTLVNEIGDRHPYTPIDLLPYRLLQGAWIECILKNIVKVGDAKANHVVFVRNIGNNHLDWTLGAALYINQQSYFVC